MRIRIHTGLYNSDGMEANQCATYLADGFRLENLAAIVCASTLWEKTSAEKFFLLDKQVGSQNYIKQMVKEKEKKLKETCLPQKIIDRILCTFKLMGQRISLWSEYSTKVLKFPRDVAATLKWTNWGAIDEKKIFEYWINSKNLQDVPPVPKETVYYTACCNVSIDYIRLHSKEILKFCEIYYTDQTFLLSDPKFKFISCSVIFLAKLELSQLFQSQKRYFNDFNKSQKGNMFRLSVEEGCPIAARYYWTLLNAAEKKLGLLFAADFSLTHCNPPHDCFREEKAAPGFFKTEVQTVRTYKSKCFVDLFMFALTRMSEEDFALFYTDLDEEGLFRTLSLLMYHSPLEEFLPLAFDILPKLCTEGNDYKNIKTRVLEIMVWNNAFGLYNKQHFLRKLCIALWKQPRSSNSWEEILQSEKTYLELMYKAFDLELLNFIINTDCEEKYKKSFMLIGKLGFRKLVEDDEYELLRKFMYDIIKSKQDRTWFKVYCLITSFTHFMRHDRFDVLDKLLDLICSNRGKQRNDLKNKFNVFSVCAWIICQNRIQTADNAIQWMCGSEEEKQNYIKNFLHRDLQWIYDIRCYNKYKFLNNIRRFLLWILESEDEVDRFKSEKLLSENNLPNLFASLFKNVKSPDGKQSGSKIFVIADELLTSSLPPENITILKHKIGENLQKWITLLGRKFCLHRTDDFLDWVFPTGNEKVEAVKTILKNNDFWGSISTKESNASLCDENVLRSWIKTIGFEGVEINVDEPDNAEHSALCKAASNILKNSDKAIGPSSVTNCNYIRCEKNEATR